MLRQKCSYEKDIETRQKQRKKTKKQRKTTTKVYSLTRTSKTLVSAENSDI